MQDYLDRMRMKRTAALAMALFLGSVLLIVSLFVDVPLTSEVATVDPIVELDEATAAPQPH